MTGIGVQTLMQLTVDASVRGRVLSIFGLTFRGVPALGALIMGRGVGKRRAALAAGYRSFPGVVVPDLGVASVERHIFVPRGSGRAGLTADASIMRRAEKDRGSVWCRWMGVARRTKEAQRWQFARSF